ncbi:MAG: nitrate/nitrite transporter NrtS [Porticoccaceae bacterium]|nr:nitrate/nitrite transporter NrtS [Porticoccaceae bacterium]
MKRILAIALSKQVVKTATKIAVVVGTLLVLINHYPEIASGSVSKNNLMQMLFTYLVPYGVSTYSSTKALLEVDQKPGPESES